MRKIRRQEAKTYERLSCNTIDRELKTKDEKKYIAFVFTFVNDIMNADPASMKMTIEQVRDSAKEIGNAFPDDNYWIFEIIENTIYIKRMSDGDLCATIFVK